MASFTTSVGFVIGVAGISIIAYCIHFDQKRRNDPDFKRKLHERRRQLAKQQVKIITTPDINDRQSMQNYFLQEIIMGQEKIFQGDIDSGIEHFINTVRVCRDPNSLLQFYCSNLPSEIFTRLILYLNDTSVSYEE